MCMSRIHGGRQADDTQPDIIVRASVPGYKKQGESSSHSLLLGRKKVDPFPVGNRHKVKRVKKLFFDS